MVLSLDRWIGKVAVVTGASSGIGEAIVEFLVDQGIIVVGLARRLTILQEKSKKLANRKGKLHPYKADVSKEEDIVSAFKWIEENLGHVHILINNAGVSIENDLWRGDASIWKNVFDVNVMGLCIATREAVKIMTSNKINGHIVHINSIAGHKVLHFPGINVYPASKFAVTALAETLRDELSAMNSQIKVTSLSPGLVVSEMTTQNAGYTEERQQYLKSLPIIKSEDVAEAVGYVLSTPENVQINELTITPVGEKLT